MSRMFIVLTPLLSIITLASCSSAPKYSGKEVGFQIVDSLEAGNPEKAEQLFEEIRKSQSHRNGSYPVLFEAGTEAYQQGNYLVAAGHYRFLADHYDDRGGSSLALAFSLFMARAVAETTTPTLQEELAHAVQILRREGAHSPWIDLIDAQNLIDSGNSRAAKGRLQSFRTSWDGEPRTLGPYIEDLEHAVASTR